MSIYKLINLKSLFEYKDNSLIQLNEDINEDRIKFSNELTPEIMKKILILYFFFFQNNLENIPIFLTNKVTNYQSGRKIWFKTIITII